MPDKRWSYSAGEKGCRVTVYERRPGGLIYARCYDPSLAHGKGGYRRVSLKHRDRDLAKSYADRQAAKLRDGLEDQVVGRVTLGRVLSLYSAHRSPKKGRSEQRADGRRLELWTKFLGANKDPHLVTLHEWETFIEARSSGAVNPRGETVSLKQRRPVRDGTVRGDCLWLRWVFNWATRWADSSGRYLMRENPVRGFSVPAERNPRRPVASQERFEAMRAVSDQVQMDVFWTGKRKRQRCYLSEILDIAEGTGRRISAIRQLRYEDLRLKEEQFPSGAIRWPADTDKMGRESIIPITPAVRAAIDRVLRDRPGIGRTYLFPSPRDRSEPVSRYLLREWMLMAEKKAKLEPQDGSLFHAYRRKWATERKRLPSADVARAGGWANAHTLQLIYQQPDPATLLEVVLEPAKLREVGG